MPTGQIEAGVACERRLLKPRLQAPVSSGRVPGRNRAYGAPRKAESWKKWRERVKEKKKRGRCGVCGQREATEGTGPGCGPEGSLDRLGRGSQTWQAHLLAAAAQWCGAGVGLV